LISVRLLELNVKAQEGLHHNTSPNEHMPTCIFHVGTQIISDVMIGRESHREVWRTSVCVYVYSSVCVVTSYCYANDVIGSRAPVTILQSFIIWVQHTFIHIIDM
jgi:hypothetical protein